MMLGRLTQSLNPAGTPPFPETQKWMSRGDACSLELETKNKYKKYWVEVQERNKSGMEDKELDSKDEGDKEADSDFLHEYGNKE